MRSLRTVGGCLSVLLALVLLAAPPAMAAPDNHPSDNSAWLIALAVLVGLVLLGGFLWLGRSISRTGRSDDFRH